MDAVKVQWLQHVIISGAGNRFRGWAGRQISKMADCVRSERDIDSTAITLSWSSSHPHLQLHSSSCCFSQTWPSGCYYSAVIVKGAMKSGSIVVCHYNIMATRDINKTLLVFILLRLSPGAAQCSAPDPYDEVEEELMSLKPGLIKLWNIIKYLITLF